MYIFLCVRESNSRTRCQSLGLLALSAGSRREIREFKRIMTSRRREYVLPPPSLSLSLYLFVSLSCSLPLSLPSVCFRLDKPCSARSHLFCPKRAAARPADCENKRLHSAPRGNTTGGGSNDNICTTGISLSTLFLVPGYIGDTSRDSPVWEILKKESFVFPRSIHEFCLDGSNILL